MIAPPPLARDPRAIDAKKLTGAVTGRQSTKHHGSPVSITRGAGAEVIPAPRGVRAQGGDDVAGGSETAHVRPRTDRTAPARQDRAPASVLSGCAGGHRSGRPARRRRRTAGRWAGPPAARVSPGAGRRHERE